MTPARRSLVVPLVLAAALAGPLALASSWVLRQMGVDRPYDVRYIPEGRALRFLSPGLKLSIADAYWLATVQYLGDQHLSKGGFNRLFPLVELVTDLDPGHGYAYQTAGIVLSSVGRLDESNRILEKGMEKGPPYWTFPYYVAFNYWFYRGDYATAARYAERAAQTPGASPNISHLAVSLASKGGTPELALEMLEELGRTVKDEATAARLDEQRKLALLERDCQALERAAARFERERGRRIWSLSELVTHGYVPAIPQDPFGGEYQWDGAEGKVHSSANSFRFSPPEKPHPPEDQPPALGPKSASP
jgi:tetratricopeptide (TPR) repeat protein